MTAKFQPVNSNRIQNKACRESVAFNTTLIPTKQTLIMIGSTGLRPIKQSKRCQTDPGTQNPCKWSDSFAHLSNVCRPHLVTTLCHSERKKIKCFGIKSCTWWEKNIWWHPTSKIWFSLCWSMEFFRLLSWFLCSFIVAGTLDIVHRFFWSRRQQLNNHKFLRHLDWNCLKYYYKVLKDASS